ncbi:tetratricopeptide repeat protein [Actinokineospora diospyrosa]|uniref:NB-ARC domain-containing protein n=1 Tax=Actinokineospora diospyrosa TaxID=103728 RepID=A0ABT1IC01_9PSEU|nr:tetratricopeptide repeat protein [Actinokineospora diospyrosa]MCP2270160.1 NB-ARC domain-containing protein [Actinokineospora diospyrosa]
MEAPEGSSLPGGGQVVRSELVATSVGRVVQVGVVHGGLHLHGPPAVVPRQLPAASDRFVARTAELAELDAAGATVVIGGAGGIGKTWLALTWANRRVGRFPDGQLFVDLHGFSPVEGPMAPAVAVRGFLDALGVEAGRVPDGLAAQAALYRSLVADRRMLVVLDNAATTGQVEQLLPGGRSVVVVTSRERLAGLISRYGAHALRLEPLDDNAAWALLAKRLGRGRMTAAATELVALCGGSALALSLVAARAQGQPQVPLTEFAAELREFGVDALDDDDPTASLPAVLSLSVRGLSDSALRVFSLVGAAPGPDISLQAAAALTALPLPRIRAVLRALEDASLLTRHPDSRYSMHDLIRGYATATARPDETTEALRRVVDFYLHTAHSADVCLSPHRAPIELDPPAPGCLPLQLTDQTAALDWFEAEHPCLLAAVRVAADHGWHKAVWRLAWSLNTFHYRRGHLHDHLALWRSGLAAAEQLGDPAIEIHAHRQLGRACTRMRRFDEGLTHLRQALTRLEQADDRAGMAYTHQAIASAWAQRGDDHQALEHATQALHLFRALGIATWEAITLTMVGDHTARLGDHDQARTQYQAALALYREHNNPSGEADIRCGLAYIAHHTGNHTEAVDHYQRALTLYRSLGDTYDIGPILDKLGDPYLALGETDQARTVWREALALYENQGRTEDAQRLHHQLDALA